MSACCLWHSMNPPFFERHMASSLHFNIFIYPELEAGINCSDPHYAGFYMPLLISGSSSPPPCSFVAVWPYSTQPIVLVRGPDFLLSCLRLCRCFTVPTLCLRVSPSSYKIIEYLKELFNLPSCQRKAEQNFIVHKTFHINQLHAACPV